jgi:hypothetical protein
MAQEAQTWLQPIKSGYAAVDRVFQSLSEWLMNTALFQNGITIGNGTPPTYSSTTGAQTSPAPAALLEYAASGVGLQIAGQAMPLVRAAVTVITTNGSGQATITYTAFPTSHLTTVACPGSAGAGFAEVTLTSVANGSFVVTCHSNVGTLLTASNLAINWIAVGT